MACQEGLVEAGKGRPERDERGKGLRECWRFTSDMTLPNTGCESLLGQPGRLGIHVGRPLSMSLLPPRGDHGPPWGVRAAEESAGGEYHRHLQAGVLWVSVPGFLRQVPGSFLLDQLVIWSHTRDSQSLQHKKLVPLCLWQGLGLIYVSRPRPIMVLVDTQ